MRLKIRTTAGAVIIDVGMDSTVKEMTNLLLSKHFAGVSIASYKYGYPPKNIEALSEETLKSAGIGPNDQLVALGSDGLNNHTVTSKPTKTPGGAYQLSTSLTSDIPNVYIPGSEEYLILRNVPDDNSCLFSAISLATTGSTDWKKLDLRKVVAETIQNSPDIYTKEILERPVAQYCDWIQKPESWGGAIELGILAKHLNVKIVAYDINLGRPITFQDESLPPTKLIVLIYSGIHYDILVVNKTLSTNRTADVGIWRQVNGVSEEACTRLIQLLQTKSYATNTTKIRVRCLDCYEILVGEMGASRHANDTGHYRYGEVQ